MKLTSGIILAGVLALGLTACDKSVQETKTAGEQTTTTQSAPEQVTSKKSTSKQIKADIMAVQKSMEKVSHLSQEQQKLQQELSQVKTKAEADKILRQQVVILEQMQASLNAPQIKTPEVQSSLNKVKKGVDDIRVGVLAFIALSEKDANDPKVVQAVNQDMMSGLTTFFAGIDEITRLAGENGLAVNSDANHEYEWAKQEIQGMTDETNTHKH